MSTPQTSFQPLNTVTLPSGRELLRVTVGASRRIHLAPAVPDGLGRAADLAPIPHHHKSSLRWLYDLGQDAFRDWFADEPLHGDIEWSRAAADARHEDLAANYSAYDVGALNVPRWSTQTLCRSAWAGMLTAADEAGRLSTLARSRRAHRAGGLMCGLCWPTAAGRDPIAGAEKAARRVLDC